MRNYDRLDSLPGADSRNKPDRITEELEQGKVVVVAGYRILPGDLTTLGRGGSDTAVAWLLC